MEAVDQVRRFGIAMKGARDGTSAARAQGLGRLETPVIECIGERTYRIEGGKAVTVPDQEDAVLQAFVGRSSHDSKSLDETSGYTDARKTLRRINQKYDGQFAPAIKFPGKANSGGYSASVTDARGDSATPAGGL